jgi:hypothetical protein
LLVILFSYTQILEDVFSSLPLHGNRWKGGPIGFRITVKGPPKGRFMRKKSQFHHNLEVGRTEAIMNIIIVGMCMSNCKRIITQL